MDEDFGYADLGNEEPPPFRKGCNYPYRHDFVENTNFNLKYIECRLCGYSPELDGNKRPYEECHKEYLAWKYD